MKNIRLTFAIIGAVFLMGLLALNMYSSTSLPGFHSGAGCYSCHNAVAFVNNHDGSLAGFNATDGLPEYYWDEHDYLDYSRNIVPMVPVNPERSFASIGEFYASLFFATNDTHIRVLAELDFDPFINATGSDSDKFAIMFNIDVSNFSIGQSKDAGKMAFSNGEADLWLWDAADLAPNGTGLASDMYVTNTYDDIGDTQDVTVDVMWGPDITGRGDPGYFVMFTRERDTGSDHDVVFEDGAFIQYAMAFWNGSDGNFHLSSTDHALVVGEEFMYETQTVTGPGVTVTTTKVETTTSATSSAFSAVLVIATIMAIPVLFRLRRK